MEYCVELPDQPGEMASLCEALADHDINIMTAAAMTATGAVVAIVTDEKEDTERVLTGLGLAYSTNEVLLVSLPHKPGALAGMSRTMANAGININSIYIMSKNDEDAVIAFTVDKPSDARAMI